MRTLLADQTAGQALLFAVVLVMVALRPRGRRSRRDTRGEIPSYVGTGNRGAQRSSGVGAGRLTSAAHRATARKFATPVWMMATLTLLCGVGAASALMADASSYSTTITGDSPTVYWRLGEASGTTATDSSGNGHNGTYAASGITYSATGAISGDGDHAITTSFAGPAVSTAATILPSADTPRTIEAWFKTSTNGVAQGIIDLGPSPNRFEILLNSVNQLWVYADGVSGGLVVTPPYSVVDGAYHEVAATYDGSAVALFLDGQLLATGSFSGALTTGAGVYVGNDPGGAPLVGSLDEAAVYPSALSALKIEAHWQAGAGPACPATPSTGYAGAVAGDLPVRYWRLGDSGRAANDYSGHCQPAAYAGGVTHVAGAIAGDSDTAAGSASPSVVATAAGLPLGASARSVELWEKTTATWGQEVADYGNAAANQQYAVWTDDQRIQIINGSVSLNFDAPYNLADGTWHHIVVTYDGSDVHTAYADGQELGQQGFGAALGTSVSTNTLLKLGSSYTGSIDEAAVYSTALTPTQVRTHWRAGLGASCVTVPSGGYAGAVISDGPSRFWRLTEASGLRAADSSVNCGDAAYNPNVTHTKTAGALISDPAGGVSDNTTSVLATASGLPTGASARSVELWEKNTATWGQNIVNYGNAVANQNYGIWIDNQRISVANGSLTLNFDAPYNLSDGAWHHIVVTYDGLDTHTVYADGQVIGTPQGFGAALNTTVSTNGALTLGGSYLGEIDDVAVYSTPLNLTQLTAHFHAGAAVGGVLTSAQYMSAGSKELICTCSHGEATNHPVDTATGNFWHSFTDIGIAGRSRPLAFSRNYNAAGAATNGPLGYGWTTNYGTTSLAVVGSTATLTDENGSQATFTQSGGVWSPSAPRFIATLVENGGGTSWTLNRFNQDTLTFNSTGQLTAEADLNGYTTSYTYTSGNLTAVTDQAGRTLTLGYTGSNITTVTDANVTPHRVVTYAYNDGLGNLTDVTDVNGGTQHYVYDASHQMTIMKDPKCQALGAGCPGVQNTYVGGKTTVQKDQLNRETDFDYTSIPGATKVTNPKGNITVTYYNEGLRVAETQGYGTASAATTYIAYDPSTLALTTIVDPNGHTTTNTVDASGNVLTSTDALNRVTTNTYNSFNEVLTSQDPKLVTTTNSYDASGNLTRTCRPLPGGTCGVTPSNAQVTTYNHTDGTHPGDVTSVVNPDSKTTTLTYDTYGDVASSTDPLSDKTTATYSADGFQLTSVTPKGNVTGCGCAATYTTTNAYNPFGEVLTATGPLTHVVTNTYDADGNLATSKDPDTNKTTYTYDVANQLTTTARPDTTTSVTDYNADGTVLDQKDGKSNAILTYGYDSLARVTTVSDALSNVTTFSYDGAGNRLTQQDPGGNCSTPTKCTTTTYDVDNEVTAVSYSDGVTPNITNVAYDGDGQRTGMTDGTGTSAWVFDTLHRMTSYTDGHSHTVQWGYNLRNLPTTITYPGTTGAVTQGYDDAGRLTSVLDWLSHTTTFGYDVNSNLTPETLPATTGVVDTNTYDAADNLSTISDKKGATTIFAATYGRDSANQLTSDTSVPAAVQKYKYTTLNQLCYAGSANSTACTAPPTSSFPYTYDTADNLTKTENAAHTASVTQQFNAADELCWTVAGSSANACATAPSGATSFTYDTRGNRTTSLKGTAGTCDTFDQADRLTSITTGTGATCTTPTTVGTYAYDGDGTRMSKTVGANTTQDTWGSGLLLQEKVGAANPTSYIYGPGGLPLEQITPTGTVYYYHHDQLGSTRAITDSAGAAKATYTYDPYGNVTACTGATVTVAGANICTGTISVSNPLDYSGQYRDNESSLYYLRARYYDPPTAQFTSLDPAVDSTLSPYAYVAGNPLNATDPSGAALVDGIPDLLKWMADNLKHALSPLSRQYRKVGDKATPKIIGSFGTAVGAILDLCRKVAGPVLLGAAGIEGYQQDQARPSSLSAPWKNVRSVGAGAVVAGSTWAGATGGATVGGAICAPLFEGGGICPAVGAIAGGTVGMEVGNDVVNTVEGNNSVGRAIYSVFGL